MSMLGFLNWTSAISLGVTLFNRGCEQVDAGNYWSTILVLIGGVMILACLDIADKYLQSFRKSKRKSRATDFAEEREEFLAILPLHVEPIAREMNLTRHELEYIGYNVS